jgi:hypothetical protein
LRIDYLEARTLLSNVDWTGKGDGTSWTDPGNWSGDAVPTPSDQVTISLSGNPTIEITTGNQAVESVSSSDPISISGGGSLSVAADSTLSGGLTMTGGTLTASGSGVTLAVTGTTGRRPQARRRPARDPRPPAPGGCAGSTPATPSSLTAPINELGWLGSAA